jgi:transposase-like protein
MRAPIVAVGDGALGFWAALRDVWPKTRAQRDWVHKLANVLDTLPRRLQPRAKAALHEIMYAETRMHAREAITRFATEYGPKYPKAVTTLVKDVDTLLTFFDFPAEHWKHLRTSNVIESPFATVRLRQRVTKGAGSRTKGLLMAYKLLAMAQVAVAAARRRPPTPARTGRHHVRGRRAAAYDGPSFGCASCLNACPNPSPKTDPCPTWSRKRPECPLPFSPT